MRKGVERRAGDLEICYISESSLRGTGRRQRTGGRVVECAGLEIRYTCKRIVSSNLTLSASSSGHFDYGNSSSSRIAVFVFVAARNSDGVWPA